ncbi:MAG: hypothetical protein R3B93_08360 [Bacteroidia bacterium]
MKIYCPDPFVTVNSVGAGGITRITTALLADKVVLNVLGKE